MTTLVQAFLNSAIAGKRSMDARRSTTTCSAHNTEDTNRRKVLAAIPLVGLAFGSVQSASANITAGKSSTKASADGYNMTGIKRQGLTKAQKREILDRKRASAQE
uniref:Uncharacterized protein n=2 Tax=Auxenochlorella protothecoides TaxID=3075 RepID=A0A1D1ZUX4_AUXPR